MERTHISTRRPATFRSVRGDILQRAAISSPPVHEVSQSSWQSLNAGTRAFMQPRFGHDFSGVPVHTDAKKVRTGQSSEKGGLPSISSRVEKKSDSGSQYLGDSHYGDLFQSVDEEEVDPDMGDQINGSDQDSNVQSPGDQVAPATCAQPVNWTHTGARDFGPDAIRIDITWDSSTGKLADLGNCTVREVVSYDAIPNPPFTWNPPNPTILTVPGTVGAGMDTHSYPPGLRTGITDPRQSGTMTAHQVYQFRCTGAGCSGSWTNIPGQAYTITRQVFPQYVRPNPWRNTNPPTGGGAFSYSREVEIPTP
jgi:hypothetical protein